jgi:hypothetical protein
MNALAEAQRLMDLMDEVRGGSTRARSSSDAAPAQEREKSRAGIHPPCRLVLGVASSCGHPIPQLSGFSASDGPPAKWLQPFSFPLSTKSKVHRAVAIAVARAQVLGRLLDRLLRNSVRVSLRHSRTLWFRVQGPFGFACMLQCVLSWICLPRFVPNRNGGFCRGW